MKSIIYLLITVLTFVTYGKTSSSKDPNELIKLGNKMIPRKEVHEMLRRANLKRTGGVIRKEGTSKGYFVFVNNQSKIALKDIASSLETIDKQVRVNVKVITNHTASLSTAKEVITAAGGQVGVILLEDDTLPALLSAPEEGYSIINITKLMDSDIEKLAKRTRCEILRGFGLAAGAMYAAQGDFVLQPIRKPHDLDSLKREEFGISMLRIFPLSLPYYGISQWYQTTYHKACEEGWAPAPTNEYQKAIWDKIHAMPTAPIKIKPETKKVRE